VPWLAGKAARGATAAVGGAAETVLDTAGAVGGAAETVLDTAGAVGGTIPETVEKVVPGR
jgi:hypothetical protein